MIFADRLGLGPFDLLCRLVAHRHNDLLEALSVPCACRCQRTNHVPLGQKQEQRVQRQREDIMKI